MVVVQFGPLDMTLTRCEVVSVIETQLELRPIDPPSGSGGHGDPARVVFTRDSRPRFLEAVLADDATPTRILVVLDRRSEPRYGVDYAIDIRIAGEGRALRGRLRNVSFGGLDASVDEPLPPGLRTFVKVADEPFTHVHFVAEVVASEPKDAHMRFVALPDETRFQIARLVTGRATHQEESESFDREV